MQIKQFGMTLVTFLTIAMLHNQAMADNAPEAKQYTIKQSTASVGTNFKKDIVKAGTIPLNKSYDELTDAQKQVLKDEYDHMPTADEPPFPEQGLLSIYKAIANAHENAAYSNVGTLSFEVMVDSAGNPKSVEVLNSPDEDISRAAIVAAMNKKYKPAICAGQPCSMKLPLHAELISPSVVIMKSGSMPGVTLSK